MAQIAIKIPTNSGATAWVSGVCEIAGYETHVPAETVAYGIEVGASFDDTGRRTTQEPTVSAVTITRKVDTSTTDFTRATLSLKVNTAPWTIYFFRALGGEPVQEDTYVTRHLLYLTLTLSNPLITSQSVSLTQGELTETIIVSASAFDWVYVAYDAGNTPLGQIAFDFDVQQGVDAEDDC